MGGAVSSGRSNDELVDNLMEYGYIRTKRVEQVFRAVDRADYILPCHKESAYKDLAWKHGNIHLSAPCVYSEVMEGLSLEPGLSFLNLGSGTGYLSTMAGLILSQSGTNHGIELHESCVKYAYERLEEFKQKSAALDAFDFCEPLFVQGNCLNVIPGRQYDRVYCGAACPESHEAFIKQFVRVGGILVIPFEDHLLRMQRVDENVWSHFVMLPVSFATLVISSSTEQGLFHLPECNPLSLQELCRGRIRNRLRDNVIREHNATLETKKPILMGGNHKPCPSQRALRSFVIPIFEESDEAQSDDEDPYTGRARFLFNVGAHPDEAITTTLQLVRAVVQQQQQQQNDQTTDQRTTNENTTEQNDDVPSDRNSETVKETPNDKRPNGETSKAETEPTAHTSGDQNNESSSDSAYEKFEGRNNKNKLDKNTHRFSKDPYLDVSDSESDEEHETVVVHRKKVPKREKTNSGIAEDLYVTTDDSSSSSNTNLYGPEIAEVIESIDSMDVDLYDIMSNRFGSSTPRSRPSGGVVTAHYLDANNFAVYMRKKITQLPLPSSLKLYINYNRKL